MARNRSAAAYPNGLALRRTVLELDPATIDEIAFGMDPERDDPLLAPWRRRHVATLRAAFGH